MAGPNFIIAGERRGGTTALANMLKQHPDVFIHPKGDSGWFVDDNVRRKSGNAPSSWEENHTPTEYTDWFMKAGSGSQKAIGEKSADYLYWHPAHARIAEFVPSVKLIVTLRNPVARAWSHYWNEVAKAREVLSFEDALADEIRRLENSSYESYCFSYLTRGDYARNLSALFDYVPKQQVLVVTLEGLIKNPKAEQKRICEFLEVDSSFAFPASHKKDNSNWAVVAKPWASSGVMAIIANTYAKTAKAVTKRLIHDRTSRRKTLVKLTSPFYIPASSLKMSQQSKTMLDKHFKIKKAELEILLGRNFDEWGFE